MSIGILGKKLGMAQIYNEQGQAVAVTIIEAGPCPVVDMKTPDKDGYSALVLGYGKVNLKKMNKSRKGLFDKAEIEPRDTLREFRVDTLDGYSVGQEIGASLFSEGESVNVSGISKGKGFAGVMKRYHFGGSNSSHGASVVHRRGGSSGASSYPGRVFKGKRMPGRMGSEKVTVKNLTVVAVDSDNNLLLVKGAVPGSKNSLVTLYKKG
ncbi:MAG: 50S ribosomal protein L3 [Synergistaceae bacterium]|jgi:large subunit ribosomal protein L3|uniref:50S ribosomal protein L3 n=1 Tax=Aminivibrio sp. TaxID=1872489 RepID=UPI0016B7D81A|nr:50S ribosomal protein L3 [Synergistaceae bacterium]MDD3390347.1 50S ribosomal protein L3 [Synergistaceae bacterium]MDD3689521.1 50S ribosomal protein L3 [Synergistaceae bacterium]MDD4020793.1 50S ribosomal protein L3 [Synergistaceae bacterium]MDD4613428.1 50S ribosomal protein L3 [Synergistaceae bacterium]